MTTMRVLLLSVLIAALVCQSPSFRVDSHEFWLHLHCYFYVLGRARTHTPDSWRQAVAGAPADDARGLEALSPAERTSWNDAVTFYQEGLSRKDAVFDDPLPALTGALANADDAASLAGTSVDSAVAAVLERAAPVYRKAWWPQHLAANRARQAEVQQFVDRYGSQVLTRITRAYGMPWPASGYPVHFSAFTNWAGAYSTRGNLLVVSGLATELAGSQGLEIVFHEAMHQWDEGMMQLLRDEGRRINKRLPPNLSHAMIFFTAGDVVSRVIPGHVPYAETAGVWQRGFEPFRAPLQETWKPYLDGKGTRDEAIAALVARVAR